MKNRLEWGSEYARQVCREKREKLDAEAARALGWGGFGGWWTCAGCGRPQAGDAPFPDSPGRCPECGPGDNFAPCLASHATGKGACNLCRGTGYVEEI